MKATNSPMPPIVSGSVSGAVTNFGSRPAVEVSWPKVAARRRSGARVPSEPSGNGPT